MAASSRWRGPNGKCSCGRWRAMKASSRPARSSSHRHSGPSCLSRCHTARRARYACRNGRCSFSAPGKTGRHGCCGAESWARAASRCQM
eukprot:11210484-Lingulodinium_polyedra.AAC.1